MKQKIATEFIHGGKHVFRKMEVAKILNFQNEEIISKCKKVCQKNAIVYAAVEITEKATGNKYITAKIFKTMTQLNVNHYFFWDEYSEFDNPQWAECPASILNLLSPTRNGKAKVWRQKCRDNLDIIAAEAGYADSLSNLPILTKIKLSKLDDNYEPIFLVKDNDERYKNPIWIDDKTDKKYSLKSIREIGYEIVEKG